MALISRKSPERPGSLERSAEPACVPSWGGLIISAGSGIRKLPFGTMTFAGQAEAQFHFGSFLVQQRCRVHA